MKSYIIKFLPISIPHMLNATPIPIDNYSLIFIHSLRDSKYNHINMSMYAFSFFFFTKNDSSILQFCTLFMFSQLLKDIHL